MSFFLHLLPSSFIPVPFPTSPFEVSMLCNDLDGQCRPFYLPSYQSPCGDSFHFNQAIELGRQKRLERINPLARVLQNSAN